MFQEVKGARGYFLYSNLAALLVFLLAIIALSPTNQADDNQTGNQTQPSASPTAIPIGLSGIQTSSITEYLATIIWDTTTPSNSYVYFKLASDADYLNIGISDSVTSHSIALTSLQPGSVYEYYVRSCDQYSCADNSLSPLQFSTLPLPSPGPLESPSPSASIEPSVAPSPSPTSSPEPSPSASPTFLPSPSPSITETPTPSPTYMPSPSPNPSPSPSVSAIPSPSITETPTPSPTYMLSPSPSVSPTESPSISPPPKASPSPTVLPLLGDKGADTECDVVSANTALAADIAARYTCYNISTSDVIFDCAGHTVTGNTSGYGFNISNAHNVVIKNCVIVNFTRGVSADNAINLTLLNNTYVNITGIEAYGIYVGNSSRSNFTSQVLRDFKPLISGSNGYLAYGVYMYNVSSSSINYVHLLRISGGNSSADTRRGGAVFGFYLYRSNNDSFAHTWFESLEAGKPVLIAASGAGGPGGNITGIRLFSSNNSYFQNTTLNGIVGTTGSGGATSSAAGSGGLGGVAIGIHSVLSFNCVFNSTSMQNITAGNGGNGGDRTTSAGNGGFGGVGGNSIPLFFESAQNFTFPNLTILNVTAGNGGSGGDGYTTGQAGNGGNAGSAYAIFLSRSQASAFTSASIRNILAGRGGVSGSSTAFVKTDVGGNGGNSSFILQEITTNLNFSDFTTNSSLANVGGAGTTDGIGGRGSGAFFYASNSTLMNRVCLQNVSSISDKDATEGSIGGVYFFDSTQNEIANSTIDIIHELAASYAVYSNKEAWNNVFVNTTFNRTSNGWGGVAGTKNFTLKWYVRVRVHDLSEGPIEGASIDIYNSTDSDVPMVVGSTDSAGYLNGIVLTEYIANGSYAYVGSCSTGDNINCYTPHNFSVIKAAYNDYSENVTIDVSSMGLHFGLTLAPLPHTSFTLTLPGITNPVESSDSVPPDAPFTAIMNFTLNVSANVEGTQGNVTPCVGKSHVNCQNETMPFFNFTNTGKVNLNWSIKFNITLPASIVFKCHNTNNAGSALVVANSSFNDYVQVNNASVAPGDSELAWCWADFNLAQAGVTIGRLDTNSSDGG